MWISPLNPCIAYDEKNVGSNQIIFINLLLYETHCRPREKSLIRLPGLRNLWWPREYLGLRSSRFSPQGKPQKSLDTRIRPEAS